MSPFASHSLVEHIARGALGIGLVYAAIVLSRQPGLAPMAGSTALALGALVALRGCPMCWTIGLFEAIWRRSQAKLSTRESG